MQKSPSPETPEGWDAASSGYAEKVAPRLMHPFMDEFIDRLQPSAEARALEVGAGSGVLTEALSARVDSLLATDFSPAMIELLESKMQAIGATNVSCQVMDGQALALADDSFDVATSSFALMLFPDRARGFAELARVLRPGGRTMVSAWAGPERLESLGILLDGVREAFPDMPPAPLPIFSLADPLQFKSEMEKAGFTQVEVAFTDRELSLSGFDDLWSMLTVGAPPVRILFDRVGEDGRQRLRDTLAEIVEQRYGTGDIRTTNTALVATAVVA